MISERIDPAGLNLEERIIDIWRCSARVKGGRRFSFAAMVVVGNGAGVAGLGYGKAREVPVAIEKAVKDARKNLVRVPICGSTIPHEVRGRFETSAVLLIPALPGTGLIAGAVTRSVLECLGIHDVLSKSVGGNNNPRNLAKATLDGLLRLRTRAEVAALRGVEIPEDPLLTASLKASAIPRRQPVEIGRPERGSRGGRRGRMEDRAHAEPGGPPAERTVEPAPPPSPATPPATPGKEQAETAPEQVRPSASEQTKEETPPRSEPG